MTEERFSDGTQLQWRGKNGMVRGVVRGDEVFTDDTHSLAVKDIMTSKCLTIINQQKQ